MNERIKEIAEQAGIAVWGDAVYMYHPDNTLDSTVMAKFAELIIRDCVEINKQVLSFNAFAQLLDKYKDHFGVSNEI